MLFKIANLNSNLALILGYLNPALNNSALLLNQPNIKKGGQEKANREFKQGRRRRQRGRQKRNRFR